MIDLKKMEIYPKDVFIEMINENEQKAIQEVKEANLSDPIIESFLIKAITYESEKARAAAKKEMP